MNESFKILLTDDDPRFCESTALILESHGYEVNTAFSAPQAMAACLGTSFDLFLIDKQMPDVDGFELMQYTFTHFPASPVIMVTGEPTIDSAVQALKMGAFDFLQKPFNVDELINTVKNALNKKTLEAKIRRVTSQLKFAEHNYSKMIHNSPDLIFVLDRYNRFTFINRTFSNLFGYTMESLRGQSFSSLVPNEDPVKLKWFFHDRRAPKQGEPARGMEVLMETAPDETGHREKIPVEMKKNRDFLPSASRSARNGQDVCIVARDVRYRIRFEQQLIQNQKMEAVSTMAGGIAHDFNNLLMSIHAHTQSLRHAVGRDLALAHKLDAIEKHVTSGSRLTHQLMNFVRGNDSEITHENLNTIIKSAVSMFFSSKEAITVVTDYADDLWPAQVNPGQIEQVLLNLFVNAQHAMPEGGRLYLKTRNLTLNRNRSDDSEPKSGHYIHIGITDTGCGIHESIQKKIFDPFFTTKANDRGTGLGLASAYGIIRHHKGAITVESTPGEGATFHLYLPSALAPEASSAGRPELTQKRPTEKPTGSILVIDGGCSIADGIRELVNRLGHKLITASSGTEGVQIYMEQCDTIDMVILDSGLSGISSTETYQYITTLNPEAKVVLVSSFPESDSVHKHDFCEIMGWPCSLDKVSDAINRALDRKI